MKHPVSQELFAYWDGLRKMRAAPERHEIDPGAIRSVLADVFMLEVAGAGAGTGRNIQVRLSGTRVNAFWLEDLKGRSLSALFDGAAQAAVTDMLDAVLDDQSPVVAGVRFAPSGRPESDAELLMLPLKHHGHTHSRILGALVAWQRPSWLGLLPVGPLRLSSFRAVRPPRPPGPVTAGCGSTPRGGPNPGRESDDAGRQRGRFTVYQGGRKTAHAL